MTTYNTENYTNNDSTNCNLTYNTNYNDYTECCIITVTNNSQALTINVYSKAKYKRTRVCFDKPIKVIGNSSKPHLKKKEISRLVLRRG